MGFKIHVALWSEESFMTFCGISSWKCSQNFREDAEFVDTLNIDKCTCLKCKKAYDDYMKDKP